jgi:branched-subunit amino acid transport protein
MNSWIAIIAASAAVFSWKFLGHLVPRKFLESKFLQKLAGFLTIALLAGLVGVQTFIGTNSATAKQEVVFDARLAALILAMVLLKLRAPFIVIVLAAAATAALLRLAF